MQTTTPEGLHGVYVVDAAEGSSELHILRPGNINLSKKEATKGSGHNIA